MNVLKFGGTSVRDATRIRRAVEICRSRLDQPLVLVASAMGDTTDRLEETADLAQAGRGEEAKQVLHKIEVSHLAACGDLTSDTNRSSLEQAIGDLLTELSGLIHGISLIRECSPRSRAAVLSFGERLSTEVITAACLEEDITAELVDARTLIRTDSVFTHAAPDFDQTRASVASNLAPESGKIVVTQGFIASDDAGVTTTLGRGGSDYTATILAAALNADSVEIWTDVDGIMSADPRVIPGARTIGRISYDEAAELAYFGARVVHPSTILPAITRRIPVWVKNTADPHVAGTMIASDGDEVRAIASKAAITLVTVKSSRMLNAYGFLRAIFEVFDRHQVSVDLVATSEVSVSMTVEDAVDLSGLREELEELGRVEIEPHKSIVCVVGRQLFGKPGSVASILDAVSPAHVRLLSFGSSEINLSLVVDSEDEHSVLERLHRRLWTE